MRISDESNEGDTGCWPLSSSVWYSLYSRFTMSLHWLIVKQEYSEYQTQDDKDHNPLSTSLDSSEILILDCSPFRKLLEEIEQVAGNSRCIEPSAGVWNELDTKVPLQ